MFTMDDKYSVLTRHIPQNSTKQSVVFNLPEESKNCFCSSGKNARSITMKTSGSTCDTTSSKDNPLAVACHSKENCTVQTPSTENVSIWSSDKNHSVINVSQRKKTSQTSENPLTGKGAYIDRLWSSDFNVSSLRTRKAE